VFVKGAVARPKHLSAAFCLAISTTTGWLLAIDAAAMGTFASGSAFLLFFIVD
jgi:hypothetical protein